MRKNLFTRVQSLYITLFVLSASMAQAARPRGFEPDETTWFFVKKVLLIARRAFDVITFPIG